MSNQYPNNNLENEPEYLPPYTDEMLSEYLVTLPPSTTDPVVTTESQGQALHRPPSAEDLLETMLADPSSSLIDIEILQVVVAISRESARLGVMRDFNMRQVPIPGVSEQNSIQQLGVPATAPDLSLRMTVAGDPGQSSIQPFSNFTEEELIKLLSLDHSSMTNNTNYSDELNNTSTDSQFLSILTTDDSLHTDSNQQVQEASVDSSQLVQGPALLADSGNLMLPHQTPVVSSQANSALIHALPCPPVSDMAYFTANLTHSHLAHMFSSGYPTSYNPLAYLSSPNPTPNLAISLPSSLNARAPQSENILRQDASFQGTVGMGQVPTPPVLHQRQLDASPYTQYLQNEVNRLSCCHPRQFHSVYKFVVEKHHSLLTFQHTVPQSSAVPHRTTTAVTGKRTHRDSTLGKEPANGAPSMTGNMASVSELQIQSPSPNKKRKTMGARQATVKKPTKTKKPKENAPPTRKLPKHRNQFMQFRSLLCKILNSWLDKQGPSTIPVQDQANLSQMVGKIWRMCKGVDLGPCDQSECDNCRMRELLVKAAAERKRNVITLITKFWDAPDRLKRTFETGRRQIEEAFNWTEFEKLYLQCSLFTSFAEHYTRGQLPTVMEIRTMWVDHEIAQEQETMQKIKDKWTSEEDEEEEDASEWS
ncbi:MAG: hypothetical protein BYD32DRAFT_462351 [Podila humilis]|nr:MAG: hypothetical protein BYD32DRAFT_462351 [Podila humilis]